MQQFISPIKSWQINFRINDNIEIVKFYKIFYLITQFLFALCGYYTVVTIVQLIKHFVMGTPFFTTFLPVEFQVFFLIVEFGYFLVCTSLLYTQIFSTIGWIASIVAFVLLNLYHPYDIIDAWKTGGYLLAIWYSAVDFTFAFHQLLLILMGFYCNNHISLRNDDN